MCLVLDTDLYGKYLGEKPDMIPLKTWVEGKNRKGKLIYSNYGKLGSELDKSPKMRDLLRTYIVINKAKLIPSADVKLKMPFVKGLKIKSNDAHIVALVFASDACLVATEDKPLQYDLGNYCSGVKIYKYQSHQHLLYERRMNKCKN